MYFTILGKPRKLKDVDINILFEQSNGDSSKKTTTSSDKGDRKPPVVQKSIPGSSSSEIVTPSASELFGDSDDSDWEGLDGI